jgi:hypothetical protein
MDGYRDPSIELSMLFDPSKINPLTHQLHHHPLLKLENLLALGTRLDKQGLVRRHSDKAKEGTSFHNAPELNPTDISVEKAISNIEDAHCWMSLLNVQQDSIYRGLVDEVLDHVRPKIEKTDPGMSFRGGWIFISSPGAITPFHMDTENSFFFHITGEKTFYAWDPNDREVLSEEALEQFHGEYKRDRAVYKESFIERARAFAFKPGEGAFMPVTAPHMVRNGKTASISMSCTYYSDRTRKLARIYRGNNKLRRLGLKPRPVGEVGWLDAAKSTAVSLVQKGMQTARSIAGKERHPEDARYASPWY